MLAKGYKVTFLLKANEAPFFSSLTCAMHNYPHDQIVSRLGHCLIFAFCFQTFSIETVARVNWV